MRRQLEHRHSLEIEHGEKVAAHYTFVRVADASDHADHRAQLLEVLHTGPQSIKAMAEALRVSQTQVRRYLGDLLVSDQVMEAGRGGSRKNAALYALKQNSPSRTYRDGEFQVDWGRRQAP